MLIKNLTNSTIFLYTYSAFSSTACHRPTIKLIQIYYENNTFLNELNLNILSTPIEITNFYKCRLNVGIVSIGKFAIAKYDMDNDKYIYKGFEVQIINVIAEKLKFIINFEIFRDWGQVPEEVGQFTGAIKLVCLHNFFLNL